MPYDLFVEFQGLVDVYLWCDSCKNRFHHSFVLSVCLYVLMESDFTWFAVAWDSFRLMFEMDCCAFCIYVCVINLFKYRLIIIDITQS